MSKALSDVCAGCNRPIARTDTEAVDMPPFTFHSQTCRELWLAFGRPEVTPTLPTD